MSDGPPKRQRVAVYALVTRPGELLLTRLSPKVRFQGWTLPGGGIEHGEDPRDALRREVYEETGLRAVPTHVLDVHSSHFTGARPDGVVEDYHGIHLLFGAVLEDESVDVEPHVVETDGSTDLAEWVSFDDAATRSLTGVARQGLALAYGRSTQ